MPRWYCDAIDDCHVPIMFYSCMHPNHHTRSVVMLQNHDGCFEPVDPAHCGFGCWLEQPGKAGQIKS